LERKFWEDLARFIGHLLGGAILFLAVAFVALGIGEFIKLLGRWQVDPFIVELLKLLEYAMFFLDASLFLFHIGISGVKFAQTISK
jgi:hypothetical protein